MSKFDLAPEYRRLCQEYRAKGIDIHAIRNRPPLTFEKSPTQGGSNGTTQDGPEQGR